MIRIYVLPLLALLGLVFAGWTVHHSHQPVPVAAPVTAPVRSPFAQMVAGAGLIEPSSESIAIGTPVNGIVAEVAVAVDAEVKKGDLLFRLDDRSLRAQLATQESAVATARAQLERLAAAPRAEDVPVAEARLAEARVGLAEAGAQAAIVESVTEPRAVSLDERNRRRFAAQAAETRVHQAEADLARLKAGSWTADLAVARAQIAQAEAQVEATRVEIARLEVRAPIAGQILQVKVRVGESASTGVLATPLMVLGATAVLHLRVDIDEHDAWRVRPGAAAEGHVRGNPEQHTALRFVRFEPFVVPKRSLTGDSTERVDTRVLQVLYAFERATLPVYVGQQMDVFIEETPRPAALAPAPDQGLKQP
jgi:HlyD family secretion protein